MRRFIRHPTNIPIAYCIERGGDISPRISEQVFENLHDVSRGGLCFHSSAPVQCGARIRIEIELKDFPFAAEGTVAWCQQEESAFAVGVAFSDASTAYGVRMAEQICYIEQYRSEALHKEGRKLSSEEAAKEWIEKYAADFPQH